MCQECQRSRVAELALLDRLHSEMLGSGRHCPGRTLATTGTAGIGFPDQRRPWLCFSPGLAQTWSRAHVEAFNAKRAERTVIISDASRRGERPAVAACSAIRTMRPALAARGAIVGTRTRADSMGTPAADAGMATAVAVRSIRRYINTRRAAEGFRGRTATRAIRQVPPTGQSASTQQSASGIHLAPQGLVPPRQRHCPREHTPPAHSALLQQESFGMHEPLQGRNPVKQAHVLSWQTPLPSQSASVQHEPADKHFLPHLTFGGLHVFFFFLCFLATTSFPVGRTLASPTTLRRPTRLRRDSGAARRVISSSSHLLPQHPPWRVPQPEGIVESQPDEHISRNTDFLVEESTRQALAGAEAPQPNQRSYSRRVLACAKSSLTRCPVVTQTKKASATSKERGAGCFIC